MTADPLYDDGTITLYQGDCLDLLPMVIARHGRPAHLVTDPPYGERVQKNARSSRGTKRGQGGWDAIGAASPVAFVPFAASERLVRDAIVAASAERWSIVFCDHVHAARLEEHPPEGLRAVRTGVWVKPDCAPQMNGKCPANGHESIAILHTDAPMRWNAGGKRGVWTHYVERGVPWHPTPKPVPLIREVLRDFTDPGDLVIDTFGGSGTTPVSCRYEGRRCVVIELSEEYARHMAQRLAEGRARPRGDADAGPLFAGGVK